MSAQYSRCAVARDSVMIQICYLKVCDAVHVSDCLVTHQQDGGEVIAGACVHNMPKWPNSLPGRVAKRKGGDGGECRRAAEDCHCGACEDRDKAPGKSKHSAAAEPLWSDIAALSCALGDKMHVP